MMPDADDHLVYPCMRCQGSGVVGRHPTLPPLQCPRCDGIGLEPERRRPARR